MSRSNDERNIQPVPPAEVYFVGGRLQRDSVSAGGFEVFMVTTLGLWLSALFIIFRLVFEIRLEDTDLGITASISATLAGLALAFLILIYQLNPKDKFLKLGFSFLTFALLFSTALVVGALMLYEKAFEVTPRVEVWFLSSMLLVAPLLGRHFAKEEAWSRFERVAYLLPFIIPFPLVTAVSERKLLTGSVLLLLLGVIGLPILMVIFVYETLRRQPEETAEEKFFSASVARWQMRLDEEKHFEDVKDRILEVLKHKREEQLATFSDPARDTDDLLITTVELHSHPELVEEGSELIARALKELADRRQIYNDNYSPGGYLPRTGRHYFAPKHEEVKEALDFFHKHSVVVFRARENPAAKLQDLWLARELAQKYRYPRSVIAKFLLEPLAGELKKEYLATDTTSTTHQWEVYVRRGGGAPQRALVLWEAWLRSSIKLALDSGINTHIWGDNLNFRIVKSHLQDRSWRMPLWRVIVERSPELQRLLPLEVLPEGFKDGFNNSVDLYEFFEELEKLTSQLKREVGNSN